TVAEAAPRFSAGAELLRVEDGEGRTAGALHRADVVELMMRGCEGAPAPVPQNGGRVPMSVPGIDTRPLAPRLDGGMLSIPWL
ncbi:hypothetical protein C7I84_29470, partial [Mesorhizobium ephedrae]